MNGMVIMKKSSLYICTNKRKMGEITQQKTTSLKGYFEKPAVQQKFDELLGDKKLNFITSVMQVVQGNSMLKNANPKSVFNAAATAAVLDLPINNNLGHAYIVPYGKEAQFQVGYKGIIQLAIRSGQYETISATPIYEGQILSNNPLTGFEFDFNVPSKGKPIGFASYFKLKNGFSKVLYMTTEQVNDHGRTHSKTFDKGFSTWKKNFEGMALKTVLKLLISKYGPMSLQMQTAILSDQSIVEDYENQEFNYADNPKPSETETEDINAKFVDDDDEEII